MSGASIIISTQMPQMLIAEKSGIFPLRCGKCIVPLGSPDMIN